MNFTVLTSGLVVASTHVNMTGDMLIDLRKRK